MLHKLLQNAAKYTPPGGHTRLRCARVEGVLELAVRDTGIGITGAQMQQVFDMFAQVSPALERPRGGLGIGLALVKSLAELHGGGRRARTGEQIHHPPAGRSHGRRRRRARRG